MLHNENVETYMTALQPFCISVLQKTPEGAAVPPAGDGCVAHNGFADNRKRNSVKTERDMLKQICSFPLIVLFLDQHLSSFLDYTSLSFLVSIEGNPLYKINCNHFYVSI